MIQTDSKFYCLIDLGTTMSWLIGKISSGICQGILNGSIIFKVLANDAARMKDQNKISLKYVDDLTISENINTRDGSTIQANLNNFNDWALHNNTKLNPTKCTYMDVSIMKDPQQLPHCGYVIKVCKVPMWSKFWGIQDHQGPYMGYSYWRRS